MQGMTETIKNIAKKLLTDSKADRIVGWETGDFFFDPTPAVMDTLEALDGLVYHDFCGANLSKYLISEAKKPGKTAVLLKPCDTYSFNQLVREHRVNRDSVYVVGVPCPGMLDIEKLRNMGCKGIRGIRSENGTLTVDTLYGEREYRREDALLTKCLGCTKTHAVSDEIIEADWTGLRSESDRFAPVAQLEDMSAEERFAFWRGKLSKCIRCNACRNVCPACSCIQCVFDNPRSGVAAKASSDTSEENLFHIIRAFHVAGRCTDCGECTRVCPQGIPLHLLNRKIIKDINEFYGDYEAGADIHSPSPLTDYTLNDVEPGIVRERSGE